jgi:8-hydroxy-5-deazaflavin:NADPH oxidoreductase
MRIGMLGAGALGGTLGKLLAEKGHEVMFGVREPDSVTTVALLDSVRADARAGTTAEAAAFGEVVVLAVPWVALEEVLQEAGDLSNKVIIDTVNRQVPAEPQASASVAEDVARWTNSSKVVKAFNTVGAENLSKPSFGSEVADMFICGDDVAAKAAAKQLAEDLGFNVVDCGPLDNAAHLEALARLWTQLAYTLGYGPDIAFKVMRR